MYRTTLTTTEYNERYIVLRSTVLYDSVQSKLETVCSTVAQLYV